MNEEICCHQADVSMEVITSEKAPDDLKQVAVDYLKGYLTQCPEPCPEPCPTPDNPPSPIPTPEEMKAAGAVEAHHEGIKGAVVKGIPWATIIALVQKYGPIVWQIISELFKQPAPTTTAPAA